MLEKGMATKPRRCQHLSDFLDPSVRSEGSQTAKSIITSAITEPVATLAGLEAARGIAAILVVLYHVARHLDRAIGAPMLKEAFQFGHAGVDFFFVISGFIILFVHYRDIGNPARLSRYAGRRFTRLMPTYWIALAMTIALQVAGSHGAPSIDSFAWSASLLPSNHEMILGVAWTLRFEILFYSLFGLLIACRPAGLMVFASWLGMITLGNLISLQDSWLPDQFYSAYNVEFFLGMAAAYTLKNYRMPRPALALVSGLLLFGAAAILEDIGLLNGYEGIARFAYGVPAALIVLGIAGVDRRTPLIVPRVIRMFGAASYSIYLFQFVFIGTLWQILRVTALDQGLPCIVQFLALSFAAIVGGVVISISVEHPLIRMVRGLMPVRRRSLVQDV